MSDLDGARLQESVDALSDSGAAVMAHPADVRDSSQVDALRDAAVAAHGRVDLVCNNAGIGLVRRFARNADSDWSLLIDVNVMGVINGLRAFVPLLTEQGHGHLNATASLSGLVGDPEMTVYNATKFAVVGMMEALALELMRDHPGVTASVLCPGPVATDLVASSDKNLAGAGAEPIETSEFARAVAATLDQGLDPDEVARLAIDQISAGRFWLLPHPDLTFEIMEPRFEAMKRGELYVSPDWPPPR